MYQGTRQWRLHDLEHWNQREYRVVRRIALGTKRRLSQQTLIFWWSSNLCYWYDLNVPWFKLPLCFWLIRIQKLPSHFKSERMDTKWNLYLWSQFEFHWLWDPTKRSLLWNRVPWQYIHLWILQYALQRELLLWPTLLRIRTLLPSAIQRCYCLYDAFNLASRHQRTSGSSWWF